MKGKRYTTEQKIRILREAEKTDKTILDVCSTLIRVELRKLCGGFFVVRLVRVLHYWQLSQTSGSSDPCFLATIPRSSFFAPTVAFSIFEAPSVLR